MGKEREIHFRPSLLLRITIIERTARSQRHLFHSITTTINPIVVKVCPIVYATSTQQYHHHTPHNGIIYYSMLYNIFLIHTASPPILIYQTFVIKNKFFITSMWIISYKLENCASNICLLVDSFIIVSKILSLISYKKCMLLLQIVLRLVNIFNLSQTKKCLKVSTHYSKQFSFYLT